MFWYHSEIAARHHSKGRRTVSLWGVELSRCLIHVMSIALSLRMSVVKSWSERCGGVTGSGYLCGILQQGDSDSFRDLGASLGGAEPGGMRYLCGKRVRTRALWSAPGADTEGAATSLQSWSAPNPVCKASKFAFVLKICHPVKVTPWSTAWAPREWQHMPSLKPLSSCQNQRRLRHRCVICLSQRKSTPPFSSPHSKVHVTWCDSIFRLSLWIQEVIRKSHSKESARFWSHVAQALLELSKKKRKDPECSESVALDPSAKLGLE